MSVCYVRWSLIIIWGNCTVLFIIVSSFTRYSLKCLPVTCLDERDDEDLDIPLNDDRNLWKAAHIFAYQNDVAFGWQEKYTKQSGGNAITIKASPIGINWVVNGFSLNQEHGLAIAKPIFQSVGGAESFLLRKDALHVTVNDDISTFCYAKLCLNLHYCH